MRKDLIMRDFQSSFLSCENDTEKILRKLFIESKPYCDELKRLLEGMPFVVCPATPNEIKLLGRAVR